jgi:hypothetical protein
MEAAAAAAAFATSLTTDARESEAGVGDEDADDGAVSGSCSAVNASVGNGGWRVLG